MINNCFKIFKNGYAISKCQIDYLMRNINFIAYAIYLLTVRDFFMKYILNALKNRIEQKRIFVNKYTRFGVQF